MRPSVPAMVLSVAVAAQTWSLIVGGDIMFNGVKTSAKPFAKIESWVRGADIATANLEIPLTTARKATTRKSAAELKAKKQFVLKADPKHAPSIAKAGFDFVGLANNHAMDYGMQGLDQMTTALAKNRISYSGAASSFADAASPVVIQTSNGVKVALVSFLAFQTERALWKCTYATAGSAGVATLHEAMVLDPKPPKSKKGSDPVLRITKKIVAELKQQAAVVVVWLHWGVERKSLPELYQVRLGRAFIEAGADCVLGAHPHVLQGAEVYAGKPILYSVGNLVSPLPASTGLVRLEFDGREFQSARFLPCTISGGAVAPTKATLATSALNNFKLLCKSLTTRFKSKKSRPLSPALMGP